MNESNKLKRIFAITAVFATLVTSFITPIAKASKSYDDGKVTNEVNPYATENVKTKVDKESYKYGFRTLRTTSDGHYNGTIIYQFNKHPSQMDTMYMINSSVGNKKYTYNRVGSNEVYIDGVRVTLFQNGWMIVSHSNSNKETKFLEKHGMDHLWLKLLTAISGYTTEISHYHKFVNINKLYRKWLHIDIDKVMSNTQSKNWETKYAKWEPTKDVFKDGYTKDKVNKKLDWAIHNQSKANDQILKIAKQVTLKDQNEYSATNSRFDNTTIK